MRRSSFKIKNGRFSYILIIFYNGVVQFRPIRLSDRNWEEHFRNGSDGGQGPLDRYGDFRDVVEYFNKP